MSTKTTWEDMARLGWPKRSVFTTLNPYRGNTMKNESHLHLNDNFVEQYGWYCYNLVKGQPNLVGSKPNNASKSVVSHTWDNTQNGKPHTEQWQETVTRSSMASLSTTTSASITLQQSITIANVASSGFSLTISTENKTENSFEETEQVTRIFDIEVGPYEKLELIKTQTELGEIATYHVPYGLNGYIGTQGDKYNGHYHWGFPVNSYLNNPSGKIELMGISKVTDYYFTIRRTGGKGAITSKAVYISPLGTEDNIELEIQDGDRPKDTPNDGPSGKGDMAGGF